MSNKFAQKKPMSTKKILSELVQQSNRQRMQIQQLASKVGEDINRLDTMLRTNWEYLHSVIEIMRQSVPGPEGYISDENLEKAYNTVRDRNKAEALEHLKAQLSPGQGVCTRCHHVDGGPNFFSIVDGKEITSCPNCHSRDTVVLKDTEVLEVAS